MPVNAQKPIVSIGLLRETAPPRREKQRTSDSHLAVVPTTRKHCAVLPLCVRTPRDGIDDSMGVSAEDFEQFARVSMPDVDIGVCDREWGRVGSG